MVSDNPSSSDAMAQTSLFGGVGKAVGKTPAKKKAPTKQPSDKSPKKAAPITSPIAPSQSEDGRHYWSVSDITGEIKRSFSQHPVLGQKVTVRGELSNVNPSSRGHVYCSLKDDGATLRSVMWASRAARLPFTPEDGMEVFATGSIDVYAPGGSYSLVIERLEPVGVGALQLAYEQLKAKLTDEGVFEAGHKQPVPVFPQRIGVVTAKTGAVIHDMLRVIRRKCPQVSVLLAPVTVQGQGAAVSIAAAIKELNNPVYALDTLIVGRGGGSFEDLFCFSEEPVVRAIFESTVPVIAGVGHEPDYSLADAVADMTCSTPTAAAEAAVPDMGAIEDYVAASAQVLGRGLGAALTTAEQQLDRATERMVQAVLRHRQQAEFALKTAKTSLASAATQLLPPYQQRLAHLKESLVALSPQATLQRGFWMLQVAEKPVTTLDNLTEGQAVQLTTHNGQATATITTITPLSP